eukprot:5714415-Amphidinium_carterae.1
MTETFEKASAPVEKALSSIPNDWQSIAMIWVLTLIQVADVVTDIRAIIAMLSYKHTRGYGVANLAIIFLAAPLTSMWFRSGRVDKAIDMSCWLRDGKVEAGSPHANLSIWIFSALHCLQVLPLVLASWATKRMLTSEYKHMEE